MAASDRAIKREDWEQCLFPPSVGADVKKAPKELLGRLFCEEMVPAGRIFNHDSPMGLFPERILRMHCGIFGMTGSGKSNFVKVFLQEFSGWGKKHNTRIVILDPHGEYSKEAEFGKKLVEVEYRDELSKRVVGSLDELVELSGVRLNEDDKEVAGKQQELLERAFSETKTIVEFAKAVRKDRTFKRDKTEQKLGIGEELFAKLQKANAQEKTKKIGKALPGC